MKVLKNGLFKSLTALSLALVIGFPSYATSSSSVSQKLEDATNEKSETESSLKDTQSQISSLENSKEQLETYLSDLNTQLGEISEKLEELQGKISDKEDEIITTEEELEQAKVTEEEQYESMKKRIQYMYENGNVAYVVMLLEAESISEMLNKAEYVNKIYEYDREMLESYKNTKQEIADKEITLEEEQAELLALQTEMEEQQTEVTTLASTTGTKISSYSSDIASAEQKAKEYEAKLEEQENTIENLKKEKEKAEAEKAAAEKAAAEKAAKEKAAAENTTTTSTESTADSSEDESSSSGTSNLAMLAAIIQCEAESESEEGKLAVGSVVMNRVHSSLYPNSIMGVIYQSGQFTPVASGRFALVLSQGANSACVAAAKRVLGGYSSGSWLHFKRAGIIDGTIIGNHVFY